MLEINNFFKEVTKQKEDIDKMSENLIKMSYVLCKEFGWDYYTLKKQPLPFVLSLIDIHNERIKEENKSMKRRK